MRAVKTIKRKSGGGGATAENNLTCIHSPILAAPKYKTKSRPLAKQSQFGERSRGETKQLGTQLLNTLNSCGAFSNLG